MRLHRRLVAAAGLVLAASASASAQQAAVTPEPDRNWVYKPTAANMAARQWFQDAKFGVFLHWGLYSQLGGVGSTGLAEWIMDEKKMPPLHACPLNSSLRRCSLPPRERSIV